jgi:flagellar hook assembly protein FlgD
MRNLPLGPNTLEIQVWDTHNNVSSTTLEFTVTGENSTSVSEIKAYPNPFIDNMTFAVTHNSAGQSLELVIDIFNQTGEKVTSLYKMAPTANSTETIKWNGTDNTGSSLPPGIYIYNTLVRSDNSQTVLSSRQKLIISN